MLDGDIAVLAGEYLFLLAHVCHVTPQQVPDMKVTDFGRLISGIDEWVAANKPQEG